MTKKEREERAAIRLTTIKRLFARSLNRCAFPGCNCMIVDDESDTMIGEMCHIEGVGKKALRHNKTLTREQRDAYDNLILLCSNHHAIIDHDDKTYTVEVLRRMKAEHERIGRFDLQPKDDRNAKICLAKIDARSSTTSRIYNNSNHYEAGVMNFYGKTPTRMTAPPDAIQNDAKKRAYINRLRKIYIDADTYHKDKRVAGSIINNAISKRFGTTALLVSVDYFQDLCIFLKEKIDATIPGRKSLNERNRPLYEPFQE